MIYVRQTLQTMDSLRIVERLLSSPCMIQVPSQSRRDFGNLQTDEIEPRSDKGKNPHAHTQEAICPKHGFDD